MNKRNYIWCFFLLVVLCISACKEQEVLDEVEVPSSTEQSVSLAFAIATGTEVEAETEEATTRMSRERTQADGQFLGIDFFQIIPLGVNDVDENTVPLGGKIDLKANLYHKASTSTGKNDDSKVITKTAWTKDLYSVVRIPYNTKSFLMYARPVATTETPPEPNKVFYAEKEAEFASGSTKTTGMDAVTDQVGSISFAPNQIYQQATKITSDAFKTTAEQVATLMTNLAQAKATNEGESWYAMTGTAKTLFNTFAHDGYIFYPSIDKLIAQLNSIYKNTSLNANLREAIKSIATDVNSSELTYENNTFKVKATSSSWAGFPQENRLPNGMFVFKWVERLHKFVVLHAGNTNLFTHTGEDDLVVLNPSIANRDLMAYPAELWYYTFSPIKTTDSEYSDTEIEYMFSSETWPPTKTANNSTNIVYENTIYERTRFVAVNNSLQYGVARLQVNVHSNADNLSYSDGTQNKSLTVKDNIQITGIMISHQRPVGYNFVPYPKPSDPDADDPFYVVYDKYASNVGQRNITLQSNAQNKNRFNVLVLPSRLNEKVYVIAEFKLLAANTTIRNSSCEITTGDRFYAIGLLDPAHATTNITGKKQIFQSDRYTSIVLNLKSFDAVYNYVPDITSPPLTLGLEVDLSWQQAVPESVWLD